MVSTKGTPLFAKKPVAYTCDYVRKQSNYGIDVIYLSNKYIIYAPRYIVLMCMENIYNAIFILHMHTHYTIA